MQNINIEIIYHDQDILVVNKPSYLLSVPGRSENNKDCLITRLQTDGFKTAKIVHRLDWETSGIMVLAMNKESHRELSRQFHDREVKKTYEALCIGKLAKKKGMINAPLRYDPNNKPRHIIDYDLGKPALTYWKLLKQESNNLSRVSLEPYTGRSHQLRVHMKSIGHTIAGDLLYNDTKNTDHQRLYLHSNQLGLTHPNLKNYMIFNSKVPF